MKAICALSISLLVFFAAPSAVAGQPFSEWLASFGKDKCFELLSKKNYAEGFPVCERMAKDGVPEAQYNLGVHYENGWGIKKDLRIAANWYSRAAQTGLPIAQYNLGTFYRDGISVEKNDSLAFLWFKKSSEQGYAAAQAELAALYLHGRGVKPNILIAVQLFEIAARSGNAASQYNLGSAYMYGIGKGKDAVEAYAWLRLAEQNGDTDAPSRLVALSQSLDKDQLARGEALLGQYQKKYGGK